MLFLRREENVRVCSSSRVEGGGVPGGELRLLAESEDRAGLKQRLNCLWLLLAKVSVEISNWNPRFSRASMT